MSNLLSNDDLKHIAENMARKAVNKLMRHGNFDPEIYVIGPDGEQAKVPLDSDVMNSPRAKARLFAAIRATVKLTNSQAVFIVTDSYTTAYTDDEQARINNDPQVRAAIVAAFNRGGSVDSVISAAGMGRKVEAVMVTIQSRSFFVVLMQHYERKGVDGTYVILGERVYGDGSEGQMFGRGVMFDREEAGGE